MKCPFRTTVTKKIEVGNDPFLPTYGKVVKEKETTDFSECIGSECPFHYYGQKVDTSSGYAQSRSVPKCRRVEE